MMLKVSFEYLTSLKKDYFYLVPETFQENDKEYVKQIKVLLGDTLGQPGMTEERVFQSPPYLALKDLPGYLQACYPQARIENLSQSIESLS